MTSTLAWLDTSADEQRRVRELIALFAQPGTLDELGLGQIRDVMSNSLFPGTSVLLTRARYFVLVPWAYLSTRAPSRSAAEAKAHADSSQRQLIEAFGRAKLRAYIGVDAGVKVKTLPSTIYWHGLLTYGILRRDVAPEGLAATRPIHEDADEPAARPRDDWHPTIPKVPRGFPASLDGGLDLTYEEASWLRERILDTVPNSLLGHMVSTDMLPDASSSQPWRDATCASATGEAAEVLRHAHLFSLAMQGASTLYGVLVAQAYEQAGFNAKSDTVAKHQDAYRAWLDAVDDERHPLEAWDEEAFWEFVREHNPRIAWPTERFVKDWVRAVRDGSARTGLVEPGLQRLVSERERAVKGAQARLTNLKLLGLWGGGVTNGLDYRWQTVKTIVTDIHEGLSRAGA